MTKLAKPVKATSLFAQRTMDQAPHRAEKPMSAFYASLNRRTSGKIYQANLCRGHIFPRHSYLLKVGS
jgi:hypothetical protein